jgi:hypothetical protein
VKDGFLPTCDDGVEIIRNSEFGIQKFRTLLASLISTETYRYAACVGLYARDATVWLITTHGVSLGNRELPTPTSLPLTRFPSKLEPRLASSESLSSRHGTLDIGKNMRVVTVSWEPDDHQNPLQWSKRHKWTVTLLTCCMSTMMYAHCLESYNSHILIS